VKFRALGLILVAWALTAGTCHRPPQPPPAPGANQSIPYGRTDDLGCVCPPKSVFDKTKVTFNLDSLQVGPAPSGVAITGLHFETSPQVVKVASQSIIDNQILEYAACRTATKYKYSAGQTAWQTMLIGLLVSTPTADQVNQFYAAHPFPAN